MPNMIRGSGGGAGNKPLQMATANTTQSIDGDDIVVNATTGANRPEAFIVTFDVIVYPDTAPVFGASAVRDGTPIQIGVLFNGLNITITATWSSNGFSVRFADVGEFSDILLQNVRAYYFYFG